MPIYLKGKEIEKVVRELPALILNENEYLTDTKGMIQTDAYLLTAKTVNAGDCNCLNLKMGNTSIIHKATNDLMVKKSYVK
jgi:hypothetical protein